MKVKGIELMQMIADGKLKEGTRIKVSYTHCDFIYEYRNYCIRNDKGKEVGISVFISDHDFEILEDKTEEIEEISKITKVEFEKLDKRTLLELIVKNQNKIIDKLNKPIDTSKETNCMTD